MGEAMTTKKTVKTTKAAPKRAAKAPAKRPVSRYAAVVAAATAGGARLRQRLTLRMALVAVLALVVLGGAAALLHTASATEDTKPADSKSAQDQLKQQVQNANGTPLDGRDPASQAWRPPPPARTASVRTATRRLPAWAARTTASTPWLRPMCTVTRARPASIPAAASSITANKGRSACRYMPPEMTVYRAATKSASISRTASSSAAPTASTWTMMATSWPAARANNRRPSVLEHPCRGTGVLIWAA